jgi:putative ABC transport system substrate-binding protein
MRRREFIGLVGIDVAAPHFWSFSTDAQQGERVRLIGVLLQATKNDLESEARVKAFLHGLEQLGWTEGRNLKLVYRWAGVNSDDIRKHAAELVALAPDILVAAGSATVGALQQATRTVPIVFATVGDPVGGGFVESLARPGGNITGFASLNMPSAQSGWSCSEKFRRARRAWRSCEIRRLRPGPASSARYKLPRPRAGWR